MKIQWMRVLLALALAAGPLAAGAQDVQPEQAEKMRAALEQPARGLTIESIEASEVPGLFAVQFAGGPMVYATADGSHFVVGDLHAVQNGDFVNLTERRRDGQRRELLAKVSAEDMIVFPAEGETRGQINVFTDITCGYCQKLHLEVPALNEMGVEVRYLAYPRAGVGSDGYDKLATAWCADDRQKTLTRLKARERVDMDVCEPNPVAEQFELGQRMGVRGTPAIVTQDGRLVPGYQPANQLMATLGLQ